MIRRVLVTATLFVVPACGARSSNPIVSDLDAAAAPTDTAMQTADVVIAPIDTGPGGSDTGPIVDPCGGLCGAGTICDHGHCVVPDAGMPPPTCSPPPPTDGGVVPYFECASVPICPSGHFANPAARSGFRVTYLQIVQPAALASAAILSVINPTIQTGAFAWGMQLDNATSTARIGAFNLTTSMRGHVGIGLMDGRFAFFHGDAMVSAASRYDPASVGFATSGGALSTSGSASLVLPVFSDASGRELLTELPLEDVRLSNVALSADRGCIGLGQPAGGRYTETTSRWATSDGSGRPYATIDAAMTVAALRTVRIVIGGNPVPLCNLVAGANCATDPMSSWPHQPDATVGSEPAFHLRANFAAIAADFAP